MPELLLPAHAALDVPRVPVEARRNGIPEPRAIGVLRSESSPRGSVVSAARPRVCSLADPGWRALPSTRGIALAGPRLAAVMLKSPPVTASSSWISFFKAWRQSESARRAVAAMAPRAPDRGQRSAVIFPLSAAVALRGSDAHRGPRGIVRIPIHPTALTSVAPSTLRSSLTVYVFIPTGPPSLTGVIPTGIIPFLIPRVTAPGPTRPNPRTTCRVVIGGPRPLLSPAATALGWPARCVASVGASHCQRRVAPWRSGRRRRLMMWRGRGAIAIRFAKRVKHVVGGSCHVASGANVSVIMRTSSVSSSLVVSVSGAKHKVT